MINWTPYLESVCKKYAQWWDVYTLTDVAGKMRSPNTTPLLTDLRVQAVKESREEREEKTEQYSVLEGLRKYAANHVLLVGRPGSGKSTAFARLLLEESEKAQGLLADHFHQEKVVKIPILVELRYYETSIIDLILQFLKRHDLIIDGSELETILLGKADIQLLLLCDGVNELPSEQALLDLQRFRNSYGKVSMIFSTRDIGIGGDLNLEKKFEMLPLTEPQMKKFVLAYLPEKGEAMLKQLGDRLREFGKTPLLLWMLCSVFQSNDSQIPSNLGLVFRRFTEIYDHKLKADVSTFQESREWWRNLLQVLAWKMMEGESKTEIKVAISRREAELILTTFVLDQGFPKHYGKKWLDDLLKHHLIQLEGNDQVTFRHQLIQEYYAAEALLEKMSESELSDEELQWNYLNYLKWTEPFALMLGMVENKAKAIDLVKLALAVDVKLGARLAGEVKEDFQKETIALILELKLPQLFNIELLRITRSNAAIFELIKALKNPDEAIHGRAAEALGEIGSKDVIHLLIQDLKNPNSFILKKAIEALGRIRQEAAIPGLLEVLGCSNPKTHITKDVRNRASSALVQIASEAAIPGLRELLTHPHKHVRIKAKYTLDKIQSKDDSDKHIRRSPSDTSEKKFSSEVEVSDLIKSLDDSNKKTRRRVPKALGNIKAKEAIPKLLNSLEDSDRTFRENSAKALGKIGSEVAIPGLLNGLKSPDKHLRRNIAEAFSHICSEVTLVALLKILKNPDFIAANNGDTFYQAYSAISKIQQKLQYYQPQHKPMNQKVYISYNWQEDSEEIANQIVQAFEAKGIKVIQDTIDTDYKYSIEKFMQEIGQGQCVIAVISDRYLKSPNCMFELLEIAKNKDFYNRIFPIVLPDAKIYDDENRLDYYLYWEEKKATLQDKYKKVDLIGTKSIMKTLELYEDIRDNIDNLTHTFKVMNTLNKDLHCQSEFAEMIQAVETKLAEDSQNSSVSSSLIPNPSSQPIINNTFNNCNIGNLAHNVEGHQQTTQINKENHDSTT